MSSLSAWIISLTIGLCIVSITGGANMPEFNLLATGLVSVAFALIAIREHRVLVDRGATATQIGASTARFLGLVWTWGALCILVVYALVFSGAWREWWQFFASFAVAAAGSIIFANMMERDHAAGKEDNAVLGLGRLLLKLQLAGAALGIISMFIDRKFPRDATHADWVACNIFFFGALAIAAICANALMMERRAAKP